ncbi:hypothetical protein OAL43_02610 [bacterium]|nr:hypothetical protein [Rubripirellula sp.]MDB4338598.1 hypothetical protein [Rubripirellula sp.]MDC0279076.1 hypothetical protein [bacterium]
MILTEGAYRSVAAVIGLGLAVLLAAELGFTGVFWSALFWAGGCVTGGVVGQRIFRWKNK